MAMPYCHCSRDLAGWTAALCNLTLQICRRPAICGKADATAADHAAKAEERYAYDARVVQPAQFPRLESRRLEQRQPLGVGPHASEHPSSNRWPLVATKLRKLMTPFPFPDGAFRGKGFAAGACAESDNYCVLPSEVAVCSVGTQKTKMRAEEKHKAVVGWGKLSG